MEAIRSSETSVLIRATRRHLPEDDNHHRNALLAKSPSECRFENRVLRRIFEPKRDKIMRGS
jgi:hypothetical protein